MCVCLCAHASFRVCNPPLTINNNDREVSSGFFYSSAEEREKLVSSERRFTDEKVTTKTSFSPPLCLACNMCGWVGVGERGKAWGQAGAPLSSFPVDSTRILTRNTTHVQRRNNNANR